MNERECGGCVACCTANGIEELDKPVNTVCDHSCAAGCAIYATRPPSCRNYACTWLRGFGLDEHRPDHLGIVADERTIEGERAFLVKPLPAEPNWTEAVKYLAELERVSGKPIFIFNPEDLTATLVTFKEQPSSAEVKKAKRKKRSKRRK